ncbi:MAG: hypothetical protein U0797_06985 [Gemmataceae bacterium]
MLQVVSLAAVALLPGPPPATLAAAAKDKGALKVTVANVRGDVAVLFTLSPAGRLKYVRKLSHGDAADLDTAEGQRWVAVFAGEAPGSEEFTATAADKKWILRAPE